MSISRRGRRDRDRAERLLRAGSGEIPDAEPVARLLAAAAAPARPRELAGEQAALAAFRTARSQRPQPMPAAVRRRRRVTAGAGVWAAVVAATATAGAAVAAGTQLRDPDPRPAPTPSTAAPAEPSRTASAAPGAPSGTAPAGPASTTPGAHRRFPEASLAGLCRSYVAKSGDQRAKALDTPAFKALVDAAGGREGVNAYCERTLAAEPGSGGEPRPTGDQPHGGQGHDDQPGREPSKSPAPRSPK